MVIVGLRPTRLKPFRLKAEVEETNHFWDFLSVFDHFQAIFDVFWPVLAVFCHFCLGTPQDASIEG